MISTEKSILAIVVENENLAQILFSNCSEEDFILDENKIVFREMKNLHEHSQGWSWPLLKDLTATKVRGAYFSSLIESLRGIHRSGAEDYLYSAIKLIKEYQAKKYLLSEIERRARSSILDLKDIKKIIQSAEVKEREKEVSSIDDAYAKYLEWIGIEKSSLTTGLPSLDSLTDGFMEGELVAIIGRTTVGKSFLALNILLHLLSEEREKKVGFFSMEMAKPVMVERLLQLSHNKGRRDLKNEIYLDQNLERQFKVDLKNLHIFEKIYGLSEIKALIIENEIKIVFIDFLGLLKTEQEGSVYERTTERITGLKTLAKDIGILVFVLVQLSRQAGDGSTPVTIDMAREAGTIEELSDFILGIWNPSVNPKAKKEWEGKLMVALLKNKRGITRAIECNFSKTTGRILEIEKERQ